MAHSDWNSIDNIEHSFDIVYCAFLDILGYKNKSEEFFQNKFNLFGRVERALKNSQEIINISSMIIDLRDIEMDFFSDSIIITALKKNNTFGKILHLITVLSAHLSFEGLFVRGGISEGKHFITETSSGSKFLSSEALQNAYLLESKKAVNPRVLIDPSLVKESNSTEKNFIIVENNDFFVDFAPQLINRNGDNEDMVFKEMIDIKGYLNNAESTNIADKYEWVLDYYYWTITNSNNYNLEKFEEFKPKKERYFKKMIN